MVLLLSGLPPSLRKVALGGVGRFPIGAHLIASIPVTEREKIAS